jgi:hypothetical protein
VCWLLLWQEGAGIAAAALLLQLLHVLQQALLAHVLPMFL